MKLIKENPQTILMVLFEIAVGSLLLINPDGFTRAILVSFGVIMLIIGIVNLIKYVSKKKSSLFPVLRLIAGIVSIIVGAIFTFGTSMIMGIFTLIAIVYGIILIVSGVMKMQDFFQAKKYEPYVPIVILFSAIASVVLGLIIIINPFEMAMLAFRFMGISLIVEAVIDILTLVLIAKSIRKNKAIEITAE